MIKIRNFSASANSVKEDGSYVGLRMNLPVEWARDMSIKPGDKLNIYRDEQDRLVIVPEERDEMELNRKRGKGGL